MCESVTRIETVLTAHTAQDTAHFEELKLAVAEIVGSRRVAAKWAAAIATLISLVATVAQAIMMRK